MTSPNYPGGFPSGNQYPQPPQYPAPGQQYQAPYDQQQYGDGGYAQNGYSGYGGQYGDGGYQQPGYEQPAQFPPRFATNQTAGASAGGTAPMNGANGPAPTMPMNQPVGQMPPAYGMNAGAGTPMNGPAPAPMPPAGIAQPAPVATAQRSKLPAPRRLPQYGANPLNAFTRFFTKYATFTGRASKSEYWWMQFWHLIVSWFIVPGVTALCVYICLVPMIGIVSDDITTVQSSLRNCLYVAIGVLIVAAIVDLALLIPSLSLRVRRLHDANGSGWWAAFWVVPAVVTDVLAYAAYTLIFIACFRLVDYLPQVDQVLNSSDFEPGRLDRFLPFATGTVLVVFAYVLLAAAISQMITLIFDLVVGFITTDPAGSRFDAQEPEVEPVPAAAQEAAQEAAAVQKTAAQDDHSSD